MEVIHLKISRLKLDALQAEQGLTCGQVAEKAGMSRQNFSTVRTRGTCTAVTLGKIARALGVDPLEIMEQEE